MIDEETHVCKANNCQTYGLVNLRITASDSLANSSLINDELIDDTTD